MITDCPPPQYSFAAIGISFSPVSVYFLTLMRPGTEVRCGGVWYCGYRVNYLVRSKCGEVSSVFALPCYLFACNFHVRVFILVSVAFASLTFVLRPRIVPSSLRLPSLFSYLHLYSSSVLFFICCQSISSFPIYMFDVCYSYIHKFTFHLRGAKFICAPCLSPFSSSSYRLLLLLGVVIFFL